VLGAGPYLAGVAELGVLLAALAHAGYHLRRALLPGWRGAPARVAEAVLATVALVWVAEAIGTVGWFTTPGLIAGAVAFALAAPPLARRLVAASGEAPPAPEPSALARLAAVCVVAAVVAGWMVPTLGSMAAGMDRTDTLWYHMPLAAKFVQTGHLGWIYYFDPIFLASFYPANSEVVHAAPLLIFHRDILSPLINLGWLALGLAAAWSIGRPYGLGPQALIGGCVALGSQSLIEFQAGEALNDITGTAFVMAAAAILVNACAARPQGAAAAPAGASREREPRPLALGALIAAGLAAGLAAGTKLSFLAPAGALLVASVAIERGARLRAALAFALPALAAGGYWYGRNLLAVGNPIPYVGSIGPISLPAPVRDFHLRPGFMVFHYWNDPGVWRHWFAPGLDDGFGALWPVTIAGLLAVAVYALWRGREPVLRGLGFAALATAIAYVFTPLTAAGEQGEPIAFVWNLRYLAPAVAIAFAILPCLPALRASAARRAAVAAALVVLVGVTVASLVEWKQGHDKGAAAAAALVLAAAGGYALARARGVVARVAASVRLRALAAAAAIAAAVAVGWAEQRHYLTHRYEDSYLAWDLDRAFRWARGIHDQRIAVAGIRGVFTQYAFAGADVSNDVQWLGLRTAHDGYARIGDCATWRRALNAGRFDYVVTTFDPYYADDIRATPEGRWTAPGPASKLVAWASRGPVRVFRITGPLAPSGCAGQRPLPPRKLHGVPNLTSPPGTS